MKIRKASTEDAETLTRVAHDAKRHWGYPERWINHWQADLTISPDYLANNHVFVAESDRQIVGFYSLVDRQDKAELDHMWVSPEHMGTGVGKRITYSRDAARGGTKHFRGRDFIRSECRRVL